MMVERIVKRIVLNGLTLLPIASVALAAESKLVEMEGEFLKDFNLQKNAGTGWSGMRSLLTLSVQDRVKLRSIVPPYTTELSLVDAWRNFLNNRKSEDTSTSEAEFNSLIEELQAKGLVEVDEKVLRSRGPSDC